MKKLLVNTKVGLKTTRDNVHTDLRLKSYARTPRQLLTHAMKAKMHERAKEVSWYMKH